MSSDDEFEVVANIHSTDPTTSEPLQSDYSGAGGFLVDDDSAVASGGGFIPEDEQPMELQLEPAYLGGFIPQDGDAEAGHGGGGGFLPGDGYGGGGGFLPEEGGGGGFIPEDESDFAGGGGFIPEDQDDDDDDIQIVEPPRRMTQSKQKPLFQPDPAHDAPSQLGSSRIGLSAIPAALAGLRWDLPVPVDSPDVLGMFEEIASDDDLLGEPSVRRDRFDAACRELRNLAGEDAGDSAGGEEDDDGNEEEDEEPVTSRRRGAAVDSSDDDDDEEEYVPEGPKRTRGVPKRATRAHPKMEEEPPQPGLDSSDGLSSIASDSDDEVKRTGKAAKGAKAAGGKKGARGKPAKRGAPTERQIAGARDTFDLFFERSGQIGEEGKAIGMAELRQVAGMLNEKLTDVEMKEMLEYALSGAGNAGEGVDLPAFARILADID